MNAGLLFLIQYVGALLGSLAVVLFVILCTPLGRLVLAAVDFTNPDPEKDPS